MSEDMSADRSKLKQLMQKRGALEEEISVVAGRLSSPGGGGISEPLVDSEGFPRTDIDVMSTRRDRNALAMLHSDHKELTKNIEQGMLALHAKVKSTVGLKETDDVPATNLGTRQPSQCQDDSPGHLVEDEGLQCKVFAEIDELAEGSPAAVDGIQLGDKFVKFGEVQGGSGGEMQRVAQVLQSNENIDVKVVVIRAGKTKALTVRPRRWNGRGLLGCHLKVAVA